MYAGYTAWHIYAKMKPLKYRRRDAIAYSLLFIYLVLTVVIGRDLFHLQELVTSHLFTAGKQG